MMRNHVSVSLLLVMVALICGCSRGPKLVSVTGTVKMDGQPLPDASVNFLFGDYPRPAVGRTDASGKFILSYLNREGAPLGACKVMVRKLGRAAGEEGNRELVPARYNGRTQFQFEVTKQGPNEFNLELNSTPDEADAGSQPQAAPSNDEPVDSELDEAAPRKAPPAGRQRQNQADDGDGE